MTEHEDSIDANLMNMDEETRRKYEQNKKKHKADAQALEEWAAKGFTSGGNVDDEEV